MTVQYSSGSEDEFPFYVAHSPDENDMQVMLDRLGDRDWYNFVVSGTPKKISPEWLARHPGWDEDEYDYAVSYSIQREDVEDILEGMQPYYDDDGNYYEGLSIEEAFNDWLLDSGKEWVDISEIKLVDREDPWENA